MTTINHSPLLCVQKPDFRLRNTTLVYFSRICEFIASRLSFCCHLSSLLNCTGKDANCCCREKIHNVCFRYYYYLLQYSSVNIIHWTYVTYDLGERVCSFTKYVRQLFVLFTRFASRSYYFDDYINAHIVVETRKIIHIENYSMVHEIPNI